MSATHYFLSKGYTPTFKTISFDSAGTLTLWTPSASTRIVLTGLVVASTLAGSTAFYFGNLAGTKIVEFRHGGSSTVTLELLADANIYDRTLVANSVDPGTDGVKVTAFGFEIPQ